MKASYWLKTLVYCLLVFITLAAIKEDRISSATALQQLLDGNLRYVKGELLHPNRGFLRRQETAEAQKPFAIVLGCADSRVAPEILFDQGIGDIFTVRVAGNVAGLFEMDSVAFAVTHFESPIIMVLGHKNCGAVRAVVDGDTKGIEPIAELIQPAVERSKDQPGDRLENSVKMNVQLVVEQLKNNKEIAEAIKQQKVKVVGGYYDLESGQVEVLP